MSASDRELYDSILDMYGKSVLIGKDSIQFSGSVLSFFNPAKFSLSEENVNFNNSEINSTFTYVKLTQGKFLFGVLSEGNGFVFEYHSTDYVVSEYEIIFDYNGATGDNTQQNKKVVYGEAIGSLPLPVKEGYVFKGWYTLPDGGGTEYTETAIYETEGNITLYAYWDIEKSILYISNYCWALGDEWVKAAAERFEQMYANTSFEQGKTGVQVIIDNNRNNNDNDTIQTSQCDIFFSEKTNVSEDYLLDLTGILNETLEEYGENISITDKLNSDALKPEGYYSLPNYEAFGGIVYDIDLFIEKSLFIKKGGGWTHVQGDFASGPDGIFGTYDDGLPSTYEEFFGLCDRMVQFAITPFIWSGQYQDYYIKLLLNALLADFSGKDEMMLNYTLNGTANTLASLNNGNLIYEIAQITEENGYKIFSQAGRYYALKFLEEILSGEGILSGYGYCSPECFSSSVSHIDAQSEFLYSRFEGSPIAMMIDGSWWQNEADGVFERMRQTYGESASKASRNFGYMPLPAATDEKIGEKNTMLNISSSEIFIKKDALNVELAKVFLKFIYTDESLTEFTQITGMKRSANYEIPDSVSDSLTSFAKDIFNKSENSDIVNTYAKSDFVKQNEEYFNTDWNAIIDGTMYAFPDRIRSITAEEYFKGIIAYHSQALYP